MTTKGGGEEEKCEPVRASRKSTIRPRHSQLIVQGNMKTGLKLNKSGDDTGSRKNCAAENFRGRSCEDQGEECVISKNSSLKNAEAMPERAGFVL